MSKLTVPCFYSLLDSEYEEDSVKKHLLYEILINKTDENKVWTYGGGGGKKEIQNKFLNLQEYFKDRYKTEQPVLDFYLRTINVFTPKGNKEEKRQIYLKEITKSSTSVFLGIFLEALHYTRGRQFKGTWNTICVTGDVEYDKENKNLKLIHAVDIEPKFKGEFTAAANNTDEKCLFVYIGNKEEKIPYDEENGNNKNITVKHFTEKNDIQDIIDYMFDKEHRQQKLMSRTKENNPYNTFIEYRHKQDSSELEQEILNDFNKWRGYFIHGIGGSGKSAFAIKTASILYDNNKIYAPVWINAETKVIRDCIKKDLDTKMNIKKFSKTAIDLNEKLNVIEENETEKYIINKIIDLLWEGEEKNHLLEKLLKEKIIFVKNKLSAEKYLLIIDNIELHENETDYFIEAVKNIFSNMENRPYLIITSRHKYGKAEELQLKEKDPLLLNKTLIEKIIMDAAQSNDTIKNKITAAKGSGLFENLADVINTEYGRNPRLIITSIFLLKKSMEPNELIKIIKKKHGRYKGDLKGKEINIYEQAFLDLNETGKKVLYMFLSFGSDTPVSNEEIYNKIWESGLWEKPPAQFKLDNALDTLYNFYIITCTSHNDKSSYMIESIPYRIFLFEEEFLR